MREGAVAKIAEAFADDEVGEAVAARERSKGATPGPDSVTDIRDVIGNGHAGQARTPLKRAPRGRLRASLYAGDALADGDGCQVRAARESSLSQVGDAVRDGDAGHVSEACQVSLLAQVIDKG